MTLVVSPDYGVEIPPDVRYMDLRERAEAACQTINLLEEHGLEVNPTEEDRASTTVLVEAYAKDEEKASKKVTDRRTSTLTPAVLVETNAILKEFGQIVATHAAEIRHLVTNKLIIETENADPRVRLRALELLGKFTDVGLFTERKEVTVTHQNTGDIQEKLREKLEKLKTLKKNDDGVYEEVQDAELVEEGQGE
jgi:hypothetical protein